VAEREAASRKGLFRLQCLTIPWYAAFLLFSGPLKPEALSAAESYGDLCGDLTLAGRVSMAPEVNSHSNRSRGGILSLASSKTNIRLSLA